MKRSEARAAAAKLARETGTPYCVIENHDSDAPYDERFAAWPEHQVAVREAAGPLSGIVRRATIHHPTEGMGATRQVGSDAYPYTVVSVSKSGKSLTARRDNYRRSVLDSEEWVFEPCENAENDETYTLRKNGTWILKGHGLDASRYARLTLGTRRVYLDPSF